MPKRKNTTTLARPKPCLGMSDTCDCNMCVEHRRRQLEHAAMLEARRKDGELFDLAQGLARPEPSALRLPPAEATVRLKRRRGDVSWGDFWQQLQARERTEKRDLANLRTVARRCGFALSARLVPKTAVRQLRALPSCPDVLSNWGDNLLASTNLAQMRVWMEAAFHRVLELERQYLDDAAREFGFVVTEAKPRRGLRGSWTVCSVEGAVPIHAETPGELRHLMREAANAPHAPHVEMRAELEGLPETDEADVEEEPPQRAQQRLTVRHLLAELLTAAERKAPAQVAARRSTRARGVLVEVEARPCAKR